MCLLSAHFWGYGQQTATDIADDPGRLTFLSEPLPMGDDELFLEPVEGYSDIFTRISDFNFSAVRYARRGYDGYFERQYAEGIELRNAISGRPLYSVQSALRYMPSVVSFTPGMSMTPGAAGSLDGIEQYTLRPSAVPAGGKVVVAASDRTARASVRASYAAVSGKWGYSAAVSRRWGHDGHIDGLFVDETAAAASLERIMPKGGVTLTLLAAPTERSSRGYTTREAFELTGDNLYNPSWGWFDGRQRSSRVRDTFTPLALLGGHWELNEHKTLHVAAGLTGGEEAYSGLRWWRDQTPYPDYYRNMPSWDGNAALEPLWREKNPRVTQIDWESIASKNLMAGGPGVSIVEQDVERYNSLQFSAYIHSHPVRRLETSYGIRVRTDRNRYFARAHDMLGAGWIEDVDQYLIDDERLGTVAANDLRSPERLVHRGDEMGHNYLISRSESTLHGQVRYGHGRWRVQAAIEGGNVTISRKGLYEKALFPGSASYGRSEMLRFFDYTLKMAAGYTFSPRHIVDLTAIFANEAPAARDIFLSPEYSNAATRRASATAIAGGEFSYRLTLPTLGARLTGYYTVTSGATEIMSYYDDISGAFSNLVMSGIDKHYYGIEAGVQADLSTRVSLLGAAAIGQARYRSDPRMDMYRDDDKSVEYSGRRSPMKNYRVGGSPQTALSAELRYRGTRGWMASASVSHLRDNYISPDPTRRMTRATTLAGSPESATEMTAQERFAPATTVGAFVMRTVRIGESTLSGTISVSNLLDERDIVWAGYEQMRLRPSGEAPYRTFRPHPSRYTYSYPRTWYASIIYRF